MTNSTNSLADMLGKWSRYTLDFKFDAKTSRETLTHKPTYFVHLFDEKTSQSGVGECALFKGLSSDDKADYEQVLSDACALPHKHTGYSSIDFGLECAMLDMKPLEDNAFTRGEKGIPINGLIWMGDKQLMKSRIDSKLADGFNILKLKIGGINFEDEINLLGYIRSRYSSKDLELRLDANGSFDPQSALEKLKVLSDFDIHSIEQPIKAGQTEEMSRLCRLSPIPIVLDEELIGSFSDTRISELLSTVIPSYIILKPSLCGGLGRADAWIEEAEKLGIGWWATSALESNIGLEAIARWLCRKTPDCDFSLPQGLGTGQLYHNNIESPLYLNGSKLFYNPDKKRKLPELPWRN